MQKPIHLKTQAIIVAFGLLLFLVMAIHVSSKEHVDQNGVRVSYSALTEVVKPEYVPIFLYQLNIHEPVQFNQFPDEWFENPAVKTTRLSAMKTPDGGIRLSGLTYEQMTDYGIRLPLFIIQ